MRHPRALALFTVLAVLAAVPALPAGAAPDAVPDRAPAVSEPVERGALIVEAETLRPPRPKVVDGDISDWIGESAMIAGTSHYDAGELIHTDFVWDAHGADAGEDIGRWNDFAGTFYAERRSERLDDLLRTLQMQLGVPYPIGADEMYGNVNRGRDAYDAGRNFGTLEVGDLVELRVAADAETVSLLVRTGTMLDDSHLGVLVLADTGDGGSAADPALGLPQDHRFDVVLPVSTGPLGAPAGVDIAGNADGWTNAVEISVPADVVAPGGVLDLSVVTGSVAADGTFTPYNIAFRHAEPVDIYNDRLQAFALHGDAPDGSHLDDFSSGPIDLDDLRAGRTQQVRPGPGYHERQIISDASISFERERDGRRQPYGLYVPSDYDPSVTTPTTFWLHYRGGKAHSGATINPRLIHELAREDLWRAGDRAAGTPLDRGQGNVVVTPHGRGPSNWYVSQSHQDFFEVFADVHALLGNVDPQRRYLAGYSMGGYGTYLLGLLYPDLFAAGYVTAGAVTQGAWTGVDDSPACAFSVCYIEANEGNAAAQLNYRILDNARHFPLHIDHGTNDELVPVTGVERMAGRLIELGYRVEMQLFAGYDHFAQAGVDEWADGAAYLQRFTAPTDPRQVTYRVVPALVHAVNTVRNSRGEPFAFNPDGAYWVDDIRVRDADIDDPTTSGLIDVTSLAIAEPAHAPVPVTGIASPGHSTPFARHGLDWAALPDAAASAVGNGFAATLDGVESVTLDTDRMGLDLGAQGGVCATLTTDGPATVRLAGLGAGSAVLSDGAGTPMSWTWTGDAADIQLPAAGTWTFTAANAGDPQPCDPAGGGRELLIFAAPERQRPGGHTEARRGSALSGP